MPPVDAIRRYVRVGPADMRDFYAIVESYEGLATVRTVDAERSIIEMDVAPDMRELCERLLEALGRQMDLAEAPAPPSAHR